MGKYSFDYLKNEMTQVLQEIVIDIKEIGNHHLNRHLVYCIITSTFKKYVLKIYYKQNRRINEINSLQLLENSELPIPKIINYGEFNTNEEWLLLEYIDGIPLESTLSNLNQKSKETIFTQMGVYLGKMHSLKTFDGFGSWNNPIKGTNKYNEATLRKRRDIYKYIEQLELEECELLIKAIKMVRKSEHLLNINHQPRLTHHDYDARNVLVNKINISAIIDFEICTPGNFENDLVGLYFKYFTDNKALEQAFLRGYLKYMYLDKSFYIRLPTYILNHIIRNCSWAYNQAPDYYYENIKYLKKIL